jgi:hypothetical protein
MKLAEHGGKRGKKRPVIAVACKLAVLLHRLWMSGDVYVPLWPSGPAIVPAVHSSVQRYGGLTSEAEFPVTASKAWPNTPSARSSERSP